MSDPESIGRRLDGAKFNVDRTRWCMPTDQGTACYSGFTDPEGKWQGKLDGIARNPEDADRFLEGAYIDWSRAMASDRSNSRIASESADEF